VPAGGAERIGTIAANLGLALTRIGTIVGREEGLIVRDENGVSLPALPRAYDHFAASDA
jgi:hypothetical protein